MLCKHLCAAVTLYQIAVHHTNTRCMTAYHDVMHHVCVHCLTKRNITVHHTNMRLHHTTTHHKLRTSIRLGNYFDVAHKMSQAQVVDQIMKGTLIIYWHSIQAGRWSADSSRIIHHTDAQVIDDFAKAARAVIQEDFAI